MALRSFLPVGLIAAAAIGLAACGSSGTAVDTSNLSPEAAAGAKFAASNCMGCHSLSGADGAGPTWKGLSGKQVKLTDGSTVTADDAYLTAAIDDPDSQIVAGYNKGVMTAAFPKGSVTAEQTKQLVAYIDTLK